MHTALETCEAEPKSITYSENSMYDVCSAKVYVRTRDLSVFFYLDSIGLTDGVEQHYVFRLQVSMNQTQLFQLQQSGQNLMCYGSDVLQR